MAKEAKSTDAPKEPAPENSNSVEKGQRRRIQGNLPYTTSAGVLRRVLERIPVSEKPTVFNYDFLGTVMEATGGAARPIIPILKSTGLVNQNGAPTEVYSQFQTASGRGAAALHALRTGFGEIFRRNQYAHRADEAALTDIIISITGLPQGDPIVRYILNTFQAFQEYVRGMPEGQAAEPAPVAVEKPASPSPDTPTTGERKGIGLVYNINVVLPETTNIEVYNAIFSAIKGTLL